MTWLLTRYRPEHREPLLALHRSAIAGFAIGMAQAEEEADLMTIEETYLHGGGEFLVGLLDGKFVAMGGFQRLAEASAELRRMRVERGLQGRGYGTKLLHELERLASQSGIRTLCLETARRRPSTLQFYSRCGYRATGQGFYGAIETVRFFKRI